MPDTSPTVIDITGRAHKLKPNETILYKSNKQTGEDPPEFLGIIRIAESGLYYWVTAWPRTVNGEPVLELRLSPKS